jgi:hypothetical protein
VRNTVSDYLLMFVSAFMLTLGRAGGKRDDDGQRFDVYMGLEGGSIGVASERVGGF